MWALTLQHHFAASFCAIPSACVPLFCARHHNLPFSSVSVMFSCHWNESQAIDKNITPTPHTRHSRPNGYDCGAFWGVFCRRKNFPLFCICMSSTHNSAISPRSRHPCNFPCARCLACGKWQPKRVLCAVCAVCVCCKFTASARTKSIAFESIDIANSGATRQTAWCLIVGHNCCTINMIKERATHFFSPAFMFTLEQPSSWMHFLPYVLVCVCACVFPSVDSRLIFDISISAPVGEGIIPCFRLISHKLTC